MTYKWTKLANQNPTEFKYSGALAIGIAYTIYKKKKASKEAQV